MRIGVDLGGTKIETIALDDNGAIVLRRHVPTPGGDYSGTVRASRSRGLRRRQRGGVAVAYREDQENGDPHEEIVRLEEHIEELAAKIESCRKFILASRIAVASGGLLLAGMLFVQSGPISGSWQRRSRCCSAALLYGVQTVAPQKRQ